MALLKISVDYDGATHVLQFDNSVLSNRDAKLIEVFTGERITSFMTGENKSAADASTVSVWLARKQNGEKDLRLEDVEFNMQSVDLELVEDPTESPVEGDPVPPTELPSSESEDGNGPGSNIEKPNISLDSGPSSEFQNVT